MNKQILRYIIESDSSAEDKLDLIEKITNLRRGPSYDIPNRKIIESDFGIIVKDIEDGATLQSVADKYNASRERVRQIYKRETGLGVRDVRDIEYNEEYKKICEFCGKEFMAHQKRRKTCSAECRALKGYYTNFRLSVCKQCHLGFIHSHLTRGIFCSKCCQGKWLGNNYGSGR